MLKSLLWSVPDAFMTKILGISPSRVDVKANILPSGDQTGSSLSPESTVN
jgi:hypothetical protein